MAVYSSPDEELTIKLSTDFVAELRQIIQNERELNRNAQTFYETMTKQLQENDKKLEQLAQQIDKGELLVSSRIQS